MVHYRYWIGILLGLLVLVASTLWSGDAGLVSVIGFAATISSLILAVLAILLSTQSNSSIFSALSSLRDSVVEIETAAKNVDESSAALAEKVADIPSALGEMAARIDRAQESWGAHQPEISAASEIIEKESGGSKATIGLSDLIRKSPPGGVMAMYIAVSSHEAEKPFNPISFMLPPAAAFVSGYLRALDAMDLVDVRYKNQIFTIENTGILSRANISEFLEGIAEKNNYVAKYKPKVDEFFSD